MTKLKMTFKQHLKNFRKTLRSRLNSSIKADLHKNQVNIPKGGIFRLEIKGKNNTVIMPEKLNPDTVIKINIQGDNNTVHIASNERMILKVKIGDSGKRADNCTFSLGEQTTTWGLSAFLYEHNSSVRIGKDCMLSWEVMLWCTDMHAITNMDGIPTNQGKEVVIGDHVWVGRDTHITKNTYIPSNSIVGWCSNVTSRFEEPNVVIAGNPAKIVKHGINWHHESFDDLNAFINK